MGQSPARGPRTITPPTPSPLETAMWFVPKPPLEWRECVGTYASPYLSPSIHRTQTPTPTPEHYSYAWWLLCRWRPNPFPQTPNPRGADPGSATVYRVSRGDYPLKLFSKFNGLRRPKSPLSRKIHNVFNLQVSYGISIKSGHAPLRVLAGKSYSCLGPITW
ncbi:MAG: hypothetical protein Ct9H300mP25_08540 [Acidobacteriota bacterium]|nr:MAG: hypothetical protein Ct9H300mP25_08540 [Acidobacteriota bacterium]